VPVLNGFATLPEADAIQIDSLGEACFLLPEEALTFKPRPSDIISTFKNGDQERKIHHNVELHEAERRPLQELQKLARTRGISFSPSVARAATRYLSHAKGDPHRALKLMQATQAWRLEYFGNGPITDASIAEDMRRGIVYFTGRDWALRPVLIFRPDRIPQAWHKEKRVDKLIRVLIFCMEYFIEYMAIAGKVETISLVADLKNLSLAQLPLNALREVARKMGTHYVGRVFRFYVCNLPPVLASIVGMARMIITERQRQKLTVLGHVAELRKDIALHQLEEDLGGTRPCVSQFFPFPLAPGPFDAGYSRGPNLQAKPDIHLSLTHGAVQDFNMKDGKHPPEPQVHLPCNGAALGLPVLLKAVQARSMSEVNQEDLRQDEVKQDMAENSEFERHDCPGTQLNHAGMLAEEVLEPHEPHVSKQGTTEYTYSNVDDLGQTSIKDVVLEVEEFEDTPQTCVCSWMQIQPQRKKAPLQKRSASACVHEDCIPDPGCQSNA